MFKYLVKLLIILVFMSGNIFAEEFKVGKPFVQLGHSRAVSSIAISPDAKYILSGSDDKTLKLWDIKTSREIRTFKGHTDIVKSVAFSPDNNYVLSGSDDKTIKLWDIHTAKEIRTFKGHTDCINSVVFIPNTKLFLSASDDKTIKLWDMKTAKVIRTFKGHKQAVVSLVVSKKNNYFLSGSWDKTIKKWDYNTGDEIKTFLGHTDCVSSVSLSSDEKYFLSGSWDNTIKLWSLDTDDVETFKGHSNSVNSVAFALNNKNIISSSADRTTKIWNIKSKLAVTIPYNERYVRSIKSIKNTKYILLASDNKIALWDINKLKKLKTFGGENSNIYSIDISKNGKYILNNRWASLSKWDTLTNSRIYFFDSLQGGLSIFSDDDTKIFSTWKNNTIVLLDTKKQSIIKKFIGHKNTINTMVLTSDNRYLLSAGYDKVIKLWDIKTARLVRTFQGNDSWIGSQKGHSKQITSIVVTPDNKYLISGAWDGFIKVWEIKTGKLIKSFRKKNKYNRIYDIDIASNGKYIVVANSDRTIDMWDYMKAKRLKSFNAHKHEVKSVKITSNQKYILSGSYETVKLWDISTGKEIYKIKGLVGNIKDIIINKTEKYFFIASQDGTVRYYNLKTGKEILTTVSFKDGEWLSITPDGYFNASKNGAKHLNILTGPMQVSSIDQYYEQFYRPDIVASVISGKVDKYAKPKLKLSDVKPAPQVAIVDTKKSIKKESLKVTLKITPNTGGIGQIRLYVDDVLVKTDGDRGLQKKKSKNSILKSFTLKLAKGKHIIKAIVYNEANTMASREDTLHVESTYTQITKPNIYAVVIGINKYKNPAISLKYAVADAELFAKTIKARTKDLYGSVHVELLTSKDKTSKKYISKTLKNLEDISPNDLFVFFVASHGMIEDAKYYMITSNVGALSSRKIKQEAISQNALRDMMANIPTTKKFIVLDTCNSGALGQTLEVALLTRGLTETTAMKVLSRAVGSTIISASSSSQEALEGYKGHGLLTYVLSDGLNGKADGDRDGYIKTLEIANYIEDTVPQIAEKEFNRAQYPYVSPLGQGFPLVKTK